MEWKRTIYFYDINKLWDIDYFIIVISVGGAISLSLVFF